MPRKKTRPIEYRLAIACPYCDRKMKISGHDKNNWHRESDGTRILRKYYVSCPCGKNLLEQKETMEAVDHPRAAPGSMSLTVETTLIPLDQLELGLS